MIPEFVGRIGNIVELQKLKVQELADIINKSEISPLKQYINLFETEEVKLEIDDDAVDTIAQNCFHSDIGARGIKNYFDRMLRETIYNIKSLSEKKITKIQLTKDQVDNFTTPIYTFD